MEKKKLKGYIAGSLFNEAEVNQRKLEGKLLREMTGDRIEWFNPIEAPINDKSKLPTAIDIFEGDTKEIIEADFIVADLTNNDVGVAMELGIVYALQYARWQIERLILANAQGMSEEDLTKVRKALDLVGLKPKIVHTIASDIRLGTAHEYKGFHIPVGFNQYVIGGIECMPHGKIHASFKEALTHIVSESEGQGGC